MFGTTLLLFGSLLLSPASDTQPGLRGPQWHAHDRAATTTVSTTVVVAPGTDLRDPFGSPRAVLAVVQPSADVMTLRDPFEGRSGFADLRASGTDAGELRPIAPTLRAPVVVPTPAAPDDTVDPFSRRSQPLPDAQTPTAVPDATTDDPSLRRPFGAS